MSSSGGFILRRVFYFTRRHRGSLAIACVHLYDVPGRNCDEDGPYRRARAVTSAIIGT
jgi:hypothetical protein